MNDVNTKKLFNDFPDLFKHKEDMMSSLMCFGFECGDGWYDLIHGLCQNITDFYKDVIPEHFSVVQVKEKFGGLRFYITFAPKEVQDMIHDAENRSFMVCEHCGTVNPPYVDGKRYKSFYRDKLTWMLTLCDKCLKETLSGKGLPFKDYVSGWQKQRKAPFILVGGVKGK